MSDEPTEQLRDHCADLQQRGAQRVVVRWIDEKRPVHHGDGMTVRQVTELTVKAVLDDELVEKTFDGISYRQVLPMLKSFDFELIDRSDNLT